MKEILLALVLDILFGELPYRIHPVVWMGKWISLLTPPRTLDGRLRPLLRGAGIVASGMALSVVAGRLVERASHHLPSGMGFLLRATVLKSTFSFRALIKASDDVYRALSRGDLDMARHWLSWHLVSRDTRTLNRAQVSAATVESLAENLSDGLIAPLIYYRLAGLPGALAYRFVNTADAMLGYRDEHREWLGKVPAKTDDVLNLLPARLSAMLILLVGRFTEGQLWRGWRVWRRDAGKTSSPNAGHPMAAMAGILGVELEKRGHYRLGKGLPPPQADDIKRAQRIIRGVLLVLPLVLYFLRRQNRTGTGR